MRRSVQFLVVAAAVLLPFATAAPALPRCPTGPTCSLSTAASVCPTHCAKFGLEWDHCNIQNGCCYCA